MLGLGACEGATAAERPRYSLTMPEVEVTVLTRSDRSLHADHVQLHDLLRACRGLTFDSQSVSYCLGNLGRAQDECDRWLPLIRAGSAELFPLPLDCVEPRRGFCAEAVAAWGVRARHTWHLLEAALPFPTDLSDSVFAYLSRIDLCEARRIVALVGATSSGLGDY